MNAPTQVTPQAEETIVLSYEERKGLLEIAVKNFFLNLITLSIYRFWARTNVRRHVWSCIRINNEPLEYTGKGSELFLGALIVLLVVVLPYFAVLISVQILFADEPLAITALTVILFPVFLTLLGVALYRAWRYRLSRTQWRGIRGALTGSSVKFGLTYLVSVIFNIVTMLWVMPATRYELRRRLISAMQLGSEKFTFHGAVGGLYGVFAGCYVAALALAAALGTVYIYQFGDDLALLMLHLSINDPKGGHPYVGSGFALLGFVVLFVLMSWLIAVFYTAREMAAFASFMRFGHLRFSLNATAGSLIRLYLGNVFIMALTFGIGQPYVVQRIARYYFTRLSVSGTVDMASITQSQIERDKRGEGLADAFEIDAF